MSRWFVAALISVILVTVSWNAVNAETTNAVSQLNQHESKITISEHLFFHDLLHGQKQIWTSPFKAQAHDLVWLGPIAGTTALLLTKDSQWNESIAPSEKTLERSRKISYLGSAPVTIAAASSFYLIGKIMKNERAKAAGFLGLEALLHTSIVVQGSKMIAGRERPNTGDADGSFWSKGNSFPSGHSAAAWALASVFTGVYPHNQMVRWGAFSMATAVTISRVTGEKHYTSDVLIGSTLGYLIGRMVVRQHLQTSHESKLESLMPYVDRAHGKYGMNLSFRW